MSITNLLSYFAGYRILWNDIYIWKYCRKSIFYMLLMKIHWFGNYKYTGQKILAFSDIIWMSWKGPNVPDLNPVENLQLFQNVRSISRQRTTGKYVTFSIWVCGRCSFCREVSCVLIYIMYRTNYSGSGSSNHNMLRKISGNLVTDKYLLFLSCE